jgi:hypothetical protein
MRRQSLILGLVLVLLVLAFYFYNFSEGFETIDDKLQDRVNPMAAKQNPLKNPAAPIGISETDGANLRTMSEIALNIPNAVADGTGSYIQKMPANLISPRIDNENSLLGLVKMCKEKGTGNTPFNDGAFAENCGMCITSGSLLTGEAFNKPTGVVVYKKDKENALEAKTTNGYAFARAIPSLGAATCVGANKADDSLPVLAINQKDYDSFRKRQECRNLHKLGDGCSKCVTNQETTWVSSSGGLKPLTLYLWGAGTAQVSIENGINSSVKISDTAAAINLGIVKEGSGITINVTGPYIYGVIVSQTAENGIYKLPIEKFLEKDLVSGTAPRRNGVKYFDDVKVFCTKLMAQPAKTAFGSFDKKEVEKMTLQGFIPITMIDSDQLAAFDCPTSPLVQSIESAELLVDDACLNPRGQRPGTYSDECLRQTVLSAGCSTNGEWYKNLPTDRNFKLEDYMKDMKDRNEKFGKTDPYTSLACRGVNIGTPCDAYLRGGIPDQKCLAYLYSNLSERSDRVGRAYKYAEPKFTGIGQDGKTINFCKEKGSLNPAGENADMANTKLREIAGGYKGLSGIEAVKRYLSDVFIKATSDLDVNEEDSDGGRKTSWQQCFGVKIADVPLRGVSKNSENDVITSKRSCYKFPSQFVPRRGKVLGQINLTEDYILSFKIKPTATEGHWANIIHFTTNNQDWNEAGARSPAIWFWPQSTKLHIILGDNTDLNWGLQETQALPMNQTSSFLLECTGKNIRISINDRVFSLRQPTQRPSGRLAIMYGSNPWYPNANAIVTDFCYSGTGGMAVENSGSYGCVRQWDHGGKDIQPCWPSGKTRQEIEDLCNRDPNCKSYNTFGESGGCIKGQGSDSIMHSNGGITSFCIKNTD